MLLLYTALINDENDSQYFEKIYIKYRSYMFHIARSILNNTSDAEDAVHDVFFNIASKHMYILNKLQNDNDLKNYLLKATKNTAINILKKRQRTPLFLGVFAEDIPDIPELSDNDFLDVICTNAVYEDILNAISNLPETYRDVLYYHFVLEFTASEIANLFDKKTATIKQQLIRGKKLLLAKLKLTGE